ncbi:MAG: quinolinate synthase NadA [Candidatus Riflebacteria bacterium]|nr:quinolinate synthase NadA [Candidatus Riflebacteria bacterium]
MKSQQTSESSSVINEIRTLKKKKNAIALVHYYQSPEIYEIADFIGDSYELSVQASKTSADMIIFCGVRFMAESAKILNPGKKVVLPAVTAGCPMAETADASAVLAMKARYPEAAVVSYMNTTAEVKAVSDIVCTSSNAHIIVNSLPNRQIIFVPDKNLGSWVAEKSSKEIILWNGFCYVHNKFMADELARARKLLPDAKVVVHPECPKEIRDQADHVCSTSGMVKYVEKSDAKEFIIGTEMGLIEMLKKKFPDRKFYAVPPGGTCLTMKKNRLDLVLESLKTGEPEINVPEEIRVKAKMSLDRMLEVCK